MFPLHYGHQESLSETLKHVQNDIRKIWIKEDRINSVMVKPIDLLVSVCPMPHDTYTSDLSTS
jgi:hypothetical protein